MELSVSIIKVDTRHYRRIAQDNWGLTADQMKGMHVHHRIKRSDGGTDDPTNLYVCSPWFHANVWHGEEGGFIGQATKGGIIGGLKGGRQTFLSKKGIFSSEHESSYADWGSKGGKIGGRLGNIAGKIAGAQKSGRITSSQIWESTLDGFRSNAGAVARYNKAKGWDPNARIRIL